MGKSQAEGRMTEPKEEAMGFGCEKAGCHAYNFFTPTVRRYWDKPLTWTCECGARYEIHKGTAKLKSRGKRQRFHG